jgi:transcriptional regulator with XRE-family HTH domain
MEDYQKWLIDFGARLRAEREKQKLTRLALATRADTKQDYIAQLERGDKAPSMKTLRKILTALDITVDLVFYGTAFEKSPEKDSIIQDLSDFLAKQSFDDVVAYFEIVKLMSNYIKTNR